MGSATTSSRRSPRADWSRTRGSGWATTGEIPEAIGILVSGQPVDALWWDAEPVRFETSGGEVVPLGAEPDAWLDGVWISILFGALAYVGWRYPQNRRKETHDKPSIPDGFAVAAMLASLTAFFPDGTSAQVWSFLITTASIFLVFVAMAWNRRRRHSLAG